ncbi:MAG: hypothetical protein KAY32_02075, partial [Candidatus Eisenbacteria sp.]|nr:hypothetical protein [Candidatus Eisenbacteria bacterium]
LFLGHDTSCACRFRLRVTCPLRLSGRGNDDGQVGSPMERNQDLSPWTVAYDLLWLRKKGFMARAASKEVFLSNQSDARPLAQERIGATTGSQQL